MLAGRHAPVVVRRPLSDQFVHHVDVLLEVLAVADYRRVLADLVESLCGHRLHRASHHRVVVEHEARSSDRRGLSVCLCVSCSVVEHEVEMFDGQ